MPTFSLLKGEYTWHYLETFIVFEKVEKSRQELGSFDLFQNVENLREQRRFSSGKLENVWCCWEFGNIMDSRIGLSLTTWIYLLVTLVEGQSFLLAYA